MKNRIIVAPLNWGLGHASRCVPIIKWLEKNNFEPVIASDGCALKFLQKEFPRLESLTLPSYGISYTKNLKLGLFLKIPKVLTAVKKEQKIIQKFIDENTSVVGVISDNRFGARAVNLPSVYITHQLTVLCGGATGITTKIHQRIIGTFNECWIPDTKERKLSGRLSLNKNNKTTVKYIGALSRFKREKLSKRTDVLVILSGVESQRKSLEERLLSILSNYKGKVVFVQGKIENKQIVKLNNGIRIYNYMLSTELEKVINQSELIICRSGYSSIMDLAVMHKKTFLIPTPNQPEQEYLASYLKSKQLSPFCKEKHFNKNQLDQVKNYAGLAISHTMLNDNLLRLFKRK